MLREFYTKYNAVWSIKPPLAPKVFDSKLDSLIQKFCTSKLRTKAKNDLAYGNDIMTNDYGMDIESLKMLIITKDSIKENCYILRYTTTNSDASGKRIKQKVVLYISVVKGKDNYRISEVK